MIDANCIFSVDANKTITRVAGKIKANGDSESPDGTPYLKATIADIYDFAFLQSGEIMIAAIEGVRMISKGKYVHVNSIITKSVAVSPNDEVYFGAPNLFKVCKLSFNTPTICNAIAGTGTNANPSDPPCNGVSSVACALLEVFGIRAFNDRVLFKSKFTLS